MTAPEAEELTERRPLLAPLRSVFGHDSLVLRHALRLGTGDGSCRARRWLGRPPARILGDLTVVIILQPYTGATTLKAVQRVIGTVVGGILTAALGAAFSRCASDSRDVVRLRRRQRGAPAHQLHGILGLSHADVRACWPKPAPATGTWRAFACSTPSWVERLR
jgi:hypothetical protein